MTQPPDPSAPIPAGRGRRRRPSFFRSEAAGGGVLLVATVVALAWANSPGGDGYQALWHRAVDLRLGSVGFSGDLRHVVNEGLMTLFFFVVGLEIKRELVAGELRAWRTAALPAIAALGGMVVPAVVYLAVNAGGPGANGWGIAMATDIAFAVGVVTLLGRRVPAGVKLFVLTLAIVDDIGAVVVIAIFYSGGISFAPLLVAAVLVAVMAGLRTARVPWLAVYGLLGVGVWLSFYKSGVHATLAGALLGLLTPARPTPGATPTRMPTVAERLEWLLHPITSLAIVPLFALANAGIVLRGDALDSSGGRRIALGVVLGLVLGKLAGVSGAAWLAVRLRVGALPPGVGWGQLLGAAAVAGVGFTVSLFVAGLAFTTTAAEDAAKVGVLVASVLASALGVTLLLVASAPREPPTPAARPSR